MSTEKILIVDDDESVVRQISATLKRRGYQTYESYKGSEALKIASQKCPDLVITDMIMPGIDGVELLAALSLREVPTRVIVMTGIKTSLSDTIDFIKRGAVEVLHKPIEDEKLIQTVEKVLALEPTLTAKWADAIPYLQGPLEKVEALSVEVNSLRYELLQLSQKKAWWTFLTRLSILVCATGVSLLFFKLGAISGGYTVALLVICLFILLSLPFDRIKFLSAKIFGSKGKAFFENENKK